MVEAGSFTVRGRQEFWRGFGEQQQMKLAGEMSIGGMREFLRDSRFDGNGHRQAGAWKMVVGSAAEVRRDRRGRGFLFCCCLGTLQATLVQVGGMFCRSHPRLP